MTDHVATVETDISASPSRVWSALTDPEQIKRYMFGSEVRPTGNKEIRSSGRACTRARNTRTRARSWRSSRTGCSG